MKLLKNLTKVVSVALASVAVFSAGLSVSALEKGEGVLERGDMKYSIKWEKNPAGKEGLVFRDSNGRAKYTIVSITEAGGKYGLMWPNETGKGVSSDYCIDTSMSGDVSKVKSFQISATGDKCPATRLRFRVKKSSKEDGKWLLEGVSKDVVGTDYIVEFKNVKQEKLADANEVALVFAGRKSKGGAPVATFSSRNCLLNVRYIVAFLSAVGIPHK